MRNKSKRQDGRGHWPQGRPRNGPLIVPEGCGYASVEDLLASLWHHLDTHKRNTALADHLGVTYTTVYAWKRGMYQMDQQTLNRSAFWLAKDQGICHE
jgi:hypothetical protein